MSATSKENPTDFKITLEHVNATDLCHTFRVAFSDADSRILLPYPQVTGLQLLNDDDTPVAEWKTGFMVSSPLDDFVLMPEARIAFDLPAFTNCDSEPKRRWTIEMPIGNIFARFKYHIDDKREWYDFLAKRSRFAGMTPPWNGTVESNTIEYVNNIPRNVG